MISEDGLELGQISDILETGANDVYIVRSESGKEVLLPAIQSVILDIDLDKGQMLVHLLPGLLAGLSLDSGIPPCAEQVILRHLALDDQKKYWVGFNLVKGIGSARMRTLLNAFGSAEDAWKAPAEALESAGLSPRLVENLIPTAFQRYRSSAPGRISRRKTSRCSPGRMRIIRAG